MEERDQELKRKVRDIIAVVIPDIDAVMCDVENGVAYIEGVVPTERERRQISMAVRRIDGLAHVVTCLSTERIMKPATEHENCELYATPVIMHYHSLS